MDYLNADEAFVEHESKKERAYMYIATRKLFIGV